MPAVPQVGSEQAEPSTADPIVARDEPRRQARAAAAADSPSKQSLPLIRIEPASGWPTLDLRELWAYRGLFFFLVWRSIKVRYAQTVFGMAWAVFQPVFTMVVFTVVFGHFARIPSDGAPYAVFSLAALVPWAYFAAAVGGASNSLLSNTSLITKVYFPRLIVPLAPVVAALVDFAIAFAVALLVLLGHGILPRLETIVVVPLLLLITAMVAVGVGCALAALNIQYRDTRFVTSFLIQTWMYASPVVYSVSLVPEPYRRLYMLNPLAPVIATFRALLLGTAPIPWTSLAGAFLTAVVLLIGGARYFRRTERVFADVA
jgi:lipopolysaccharide transport system permease protein